MSTLAQVLKERHARNREQVKALLQIGDDELSQMVFDTAYEYLENVFGVNAFGMEHLPKTQDFWNWWRIEWGKIDSIFLSAVEPVPTEGVGFRNAICKVRQRDHSNSYRVVRHVSELRDEYRYYHEASMSNRYINDSIVRAGAREMINSLIHKNERQTI